MNEFRPPQNMEAVLKAIVAIDKGGPKLAEEDEIFAGNRLRFRLGEVALTSRHDAENAIWEETPGRSWEDRMAIKSEYTLVK